MVMSRCMQWVHNHQTHEIKEGIYNYDVFVPLDSSKERVTAAEIYCNLIYALFTTSDYEDLGSSFIKR